jgi:anti-sigma28 factor (negative regulator of flagellin synthesis)
MKIPKIPGLGTTSTLPQSQEQAPRVTKAEVQKPQAEVPSDAVKVSPDLAAEAGGIERSPEREAKITRLRDLIEKEKYHADTYSVAAAVYRDLLM